MNFMKGKKGLIMGVANERSIAWGIAQEASSNGAILAFTYQNEIFKNRIIKLARSIESKTVVKCLSLIHI